MGFSVYVASGYRRDVGRCLRSGERLGAVYLNAMALGHCRRGIVDLNVAIDLERLRHGVVPDLERARQRISKVAHLGSRVVEAAG